MGRKDVEIECTVKAVTDRAILIHDGKHEAWIPKSQISDYSGSDDLDTAVESIFIPEWLAIERGLV